ncbi:MAG: hypothetical protein JNL07_01750, partial [Rhodospirillales bacterium]|nr:hypothetical protein [Rhodospirillales bacterium]
TLASVVAVSGAAAASAAGRVTNPVLRFLLAMFNVRLGYWTPNPRRVAAGEFATASARLLKRPDPGTLYLLKEMTGLVHQDGWLVNLSDGGHVENLGVYELLRRRCRLIVAVDAEQDAAMSYASFGDVVRFAQIDMALKIEIDLDGLRLREEADGYVDKTPVSRRHYAIGTIEYPERPGDPLEPRAFTGVLVYVKTSLCADDPEEIWKYKATHPAFPHDPTVADQFFDEEQFEAYRALGYEAIASLLWDMKDRGI